MSKAVVRLDTQRVALQPVPETAYNRRLFLLWKCSQWVPIGSGTESVDALFVLQEWVFS